MNERSAKVYLVLLRMKDASPLSLKNELRMALIKQQTIVDTFIALFDFFWQQSMDVEAWKAQQKISNIKKI